MKQVLWMNLGVGFLFVLLASQAPAQSRYRVQRMREVYALTNVPIRPVDATALNINSRVTGRVVLATPQGNRSFPFAWQRLSGVVVMNVPAGHTGASAGDIDDEGAVVGALTHPDFGALGYLWKSTAADAYKLIEDLPDRYPLAFNGRIMAGTGESAWVYDLRTGTLTDLVLGGQVQPGINEAVDVNDNGDVVGTISTVFPDGSTRPRAFRWRFNQIGSVQSRIELLPMPLATYWTEGTGVNGQGDIVGFFFDSFDQSVAFWDGLTGEFENLGMAPNEFITRAKAINDRGVIVGWSPNDHPDGLDTPFVWINGTFYNLNNLLAESLPNLTVVYRAYDINDSGVILAELFQPFDTVRFEMVLLIPSRYQ